MHDADYGSQPAADNGLKVNLFHFLGKLGIDLADRASPWSVILNIGAGVMLFDFEQEILGTSGTSGATRGPRSVTRRAEGSRYTSTFRATWPFPSPRAPSLRAAPGCGP